MKLINESIQCSADSSFTVMHGHGRSFGAGYHRHPEWEFTWLISGTGQMVVGDCFRRFCAPELIVHGPGLPHAYRADPGCLATTIYLQFHPTLFGGEFWQMPECRALIRLRERAGRGLLLSQRFGGEAAGLLQKVDCARDAARLAGLLELLEIAAMDRKAVPLAGPGYTIPPSASGTTMAGRILHLLEENWQEGLPLAQAAAQLRLHPQSLSRHCRRHFKRGWSQIFMERRLSEAARRLLETDDSILDVAMGRGFNNLSHFNRLFLRYYEGTPRAFRGRAVGI